MTDGGGDGVELPGLSLCTISMYLATAIRKQKKGTEMDFPRSCSDAFDLPSVCLFVVPAVNLQKSFFSVLPLLVGMLPYGF